jgi:hypothetical protein
MPSSRGGGFLCEVERNPALARRQQGVTMSTERTKIAPAEQMLMNRQVVAAAEQEPLRRGMHAARWERSGLLGRLRRRRASY